MKFTSTIYPQLVVHDLDITFIDGEAEVTDKTVIDGLRGLPDELGVRAVGGRPAARTLPAPDRTVGGPKAD